MAIQRFIGRIQQRFSTLAAITATNPILLEGEVWTEKDASTGRSTGRRKVGDGVIGAGDVITGTAFNSLPFEPTAGGGSGDVVGPASATDGRAALFDGATGKLLKQASAAPVLEGDSRLSDPRTPTAHNQSWSTITGTPTTLSGYGITNGFTEANVRATPLTGFTSGAGTVAATDSVLAAIQKLNGNVAAAVAGSVTAVTGTAPIVSSGGTTPALSISPATASEAGSMSSADKTKIDSITVNSATVVRKLVRNNSGVTIAKGQAVYQTGSSGVTITVALADASAEATASQTLGLAQDDIADNATGYVIALGELTGVNSAALTEGQIVWLSETAGGLTTTRPTQPAHSVVLGYCVKQGPGASGILYVKVDNGLELDELHDVLISSPSTGQVLRRASDGLWKNATLAAADMSGLATVATTGAYTDLTGKPTLGTAAPLDVAATGDASSTQVVKGNDSRLSDARTPTAHNQAFSTITGTPTTLTGYGITDAQPLDSDLTSIAALTTTTYGRSQLALADAAADTAQLNVFSSSLKGLAPSSGGGTSNFLRADGTWATPAGDWDTLIGTELSLTTTATATLGRMHVCSGTAADYTVTLPTAASQSGKVIGFRMSSALTRFVTIDGNASETIDGALTRVMWANEVAILRSDGSNWHKIAGKSIPLSAHISRRSADGAVSIAHATQTTVPLVRSVLDNSGRMLDLANSAIICRRSGNYLLSGTLTYGPMPNGNASNLQFLAVANGTAVTPVCIFPAAAINSYPSLIGNVINTLSATDSVVMRTYQAGTNTSAPLFLNTSDTTCYLRLTEYAPW